ncbi:EAL domain-containing protein, partial [Aurantimonas sp. A2-1-M11]|uniref:EAL domain-containing protein n=1 Tax=Aurantimonas sp. A2-1-M11 TaxID=3113712 RepID=UPI002F95A126
KTQTIVAGVIETARALGFTVVAEGIEEQEVLAVLREMRCDFGQGYYISHPLWDDDLLGWLAEKQALTT